MSKFNDKLKEFKDGDLVGKNDGIIRILTFFLGEIEFGIEINYVIEIIGLQTFVKVPNTYDFIPGIINLRGEIIPLIDVNRRLLLTTSTANDNATIIVVKINNINIGLIVDSVNEVINILNEKYVPVLLPKKSIEHRFIKSYCKVGDTTKMILNPEGIISTEELSETLNSYQKELAQNDII